MAIDCIFESLQEYADALGITIQEFSDTLREPPEPIIIPDPVNPDQTGTLLDDPAFFPSAELDEEEDEELTRQLARHG